MKVTFIGATHEVTGSCSLLEVGNSAFLVDCGMEQGENRFENIPLPVNPAELSCVLLTHAHIDHSGYLPLLYKNGFRGTVYATESTASLCQIMLRDSAHIQESEAEWKNRKARRAGRPEAEALYTMADAEGVLSRFRPCPYNKLTAVGEGVAVRFTDIGHLLGSAAIEIWMSEGGVTKRWCSAVTWGIRISPSSTTRSGWSRQIIWCWNPPTATGCTVSARIMWAR